MTDVPKNGSMHKPDGSGAVQGDSHSIPDKGTGTGVSDTYGADLSQGATNRIGSIAGATKSDSAFDNMPDRMGQKDGDE